MANYQSWLVAVCCCLCAIGTKAANISPRQNSGVNSENEPEGPHNASSTMYFHQMFSKEATGSSSDSEQKPATMAASAVPTVAINHNHESHHRSKHQHNHHQLPHHPTSIQAVNKTVNGANLTSSETQHYYGYEPTGINKRHVHYPPVPMDVVNNEDTQDDDTDDSDDADDDADTDYDTESGEPNSEASQSPQNGPDGDDGEEQDRDDDFDHSASFTIPKIDSNHKGCKTVYKEIQTVPGKVKTADDDFDGDFGFRRKRSVGGAEEPKSATSSSFVIARECHYTEDDKADRRNRNNPVHASDGPISAAAVAKQSPKSSPITVPPNAVAPVSESASSSTPTVKPTSVPVTDAVPSKPKVTAGESRFVPINADPLRNRRSHRGPRGINPNQYGQYGQNPQYAQHHQSQGRPRYNNYNMAPMIPYLSADEVTARQTQQLYGHESPNRRHFHQYPYPHYHIYYNRRGSSTLNGQERPRESKHSAEPYSGQANHQPESEPNTYESPNSYFEFTNPHESGNQGGGEGDGDQHQDSDDDDDSEDRDEQDDDADLAASPPEGRTLRRRRGLRAVRGYVPPVAALPLPPTLKPSRPLLNSDDEYGWAVSGPDFYKSGRYHGGDGQKKPKRYSYNYFKREKQPTKKSAKSSDSDLDDAPPSHRPRTSHHKVITTKIVHDLPAKHDGPRKGRKQMSNDEDDYTIHYGGGNNEEYNHEYDSDKEKKKNRDKNRKQANDHGGHDHSGDSDAGHSGHNDDGGYGSHFQGDHNDGQDDDDDY